ncbi:hypothetical protein THARTR1_03687 [Trichoderma harzianum]|uniref:Uncharacterized protein n=1 Tax=Trichoderma harzianum TaxID=5544 RepID=A0A2K0UEG5_TRIHA|nr:hypothetical protein THARTR1_03687 [Trichoderma harzianum]
MCGPEITNKPRGGALAALSSPDNAGRLRTICGDLAFHTPGRPESNEATHARLTPDAAYDARTLSNLHVVIHSSGDLTRRVEDCGTFQQFQFPTTAESFDKAFIELPLDKPLSLEVGSDGIIGRRVSLYSRSVPNHVVAEGIVGFNFLSMAQPSL